MVELPVLSRKLQWENSSYNLVAVIERYSKSGNIGFGPVGGQTLKEGAFATTYAHDHHNLMVMGTNPQDMAIAANHLIDIQGGMVIVMNSVMTAAVDLPVAVLLSEEPVEIIAKKLKKITYCLRELGIDHPNPIMSLCTITLPVSPEIKITDRGLANASAGEIVPLFVLRSERQC